MSGSPKRLCGTGSPAASSTIEGNFASFWKIGEVLSHLIHWNVNCMGYRSGLLNFGRGADVYNHQWFCRLNLLFQVRNCNAFGCFILHMDHYDTSASDGPIALSRSI